jgi:hypothetical protein
MALIFYLAMGCSLLSKNHHLTKPVPTLGQGGVLPDDWAEGEKKTLELIQYAEQSDAWRNWARTAYHNYDEFQKSHHGEISPRDLAEIQFMGTQYVDQIWRPLWDLMLSPYFYLDLSKNIQIQTQRETYIEKDVVRYVDSMGEVMEYEEDPIDGTTHEQMLVNVYHINPLDRRGQIFLREFEVSFSAALILIDNFEIGWQPYMENKVIRRILLYDSANQEDEARQAIQVIWRNYTKYRKSEKLIAAFKIYQKAAQIQKHSSGDALNSYSHPLTEIIENSPAFKKLVEHPNNEGLFQRVVNRVKVLFRNQGDSLKLIKVHTFHIFNKAFGLSADLMQTRDGYLKDMSGKDYERLVGTVKPLDVLLQRSRSRLTDKLIPGHYGHVGIWVGTEEELKELEIWDQLPGLYQIAKEKYGYQGPSFQETVRNGKKLIEALAPGVQLHAMRNFLDADDLVVLRPEPCRKHPTGSTACLTRQKKREYLLNAFRQIGKKYDFNLNFNSDSELVCSEVAYWTYVDFDIKTNRAMGKHYVVPDEIARRADDANDPFSPIVLYVNGNRIWKEGEPLRHELKRVLAGGTFERDELREP